MGLGFGVYLRGAKDQGHNQAPGFTAGLNDLDQTINEIDDTVVAYQGVKKRNGKWEILQSAI